MVFERCYSQAPWTKPSIGSLFTGVLPRVHRATISHNDAQELEKVTVQMLRPQFVTIAERLHEVGYHTAYFLANPHTQQEYGFARGFDHYHYMYSQECERQAHEVIQWLYQTAREPFFVFVHEIKPHRPYDPPPQSFERQHRVTIDAALEALPEADKAILIDQHLVGKREGTRAMARRSVRELSPDGLRLLAQLYQAQVDYMDTQFGRIFGFAKRQGLLERTLFAFTSDHGEAFNEHGRFYHSNSLYDEELHVPLVIRPPGGIKATRIPWTVGLYDLYPTLLDIAGAPSPDYVQSTPLLDGRGSIIVTKDRPVLSDHDAGALPPDRWSSSLIVGDHKIIAREDPHRVQVFDRSVDAGETDDLAQATSPANPLVAALSEQLSTAKAKADALATSFGEPEWVGPLDGMQDQLEALGYM